jgi:hypothetical protein
MTEITYESGAIAAILKWLLSQLDSHDQQG